MKSIELEKLEQRYQVQIRKDEFNFTVGIVRDIVLNNDILVSERFVNDEYPPHYFKYPSVMKCLDVAGRTLKRLTKKEIDMETIDLRECPKRYEIHVSKQHFNYVFSIIQVTQLDDSVTLAEHLEVKYPPDGGVYPSTEEAVAAALTVMKRIAPNANVKIGVDDSDNESE